MSKISYVTPPCPVCHTRDVFELDGEMLRTWQNGGLIQSCFPELSSDEREQIKTGYHSDCWEKEFTENHDWEGENA